VSVIREGRCAGLTFAELAQREKETLLGWRGMEMLERGLVLEVKFMHRESGAPAVLMLGSGGEEKRLRGTAAALVLLETQPGARVYYSRRRDLSEELFRAQLRRQPGPEVLAEHVAAPGQVLLAPLGLPHALGAGVWAYYTAVKAEGDRGLLSARRTYTPLAVSVPAARAFIPNLGFIQGMNAITFLYAADWCATVRLDLRAEYVDTVRPGPRPSFFILTALAGQGLLTSDRYTETLPAGTSVLVAAACKSFTISPGSEGLTVLKTWVPDHHSDIERPLRERGMSQREIAGLYGFFGREGK
jgi:hypothetical protein